MINGWPVGQFLNIMHPFWVLFQFFNIIPYLYVYLVYSTKICIKNHWLLPITFVNMWLTLKLSIWNFAKLSVLGARHLCPCIVKCICVKCRRNIGTSPEVGGCRFNFLTGRSRSPCASRNVRSSYRVVHAYIKRPRVACESTPRSPPSVLRY